MLVACFSLQTWGFLFFNDTTLKGHACFCYLLRPLFIQWGPIVYLHSLSLNKCRLDFFFSFSLEEYFFRLWESILDRREQLAGLGTSLDQYCGQFMSIYLPWPFWKSLFFPGVVPQLTCASSVFNPDGLCFAVIQ